MKIIHLIPMFYLPLIISGMDFSICYSSLSLDHEELTRPAGINYTIAAPLQEKLDFRVSYGRVSNDRHYNGDLIVGGYTVGWAPHDRILSKSLLQYAAIGFEAHLIDSKWIDANVSLMSSYSSLSGERENLDFIGYKRELYAAEKWGVQLGCELGLRMWAEAPVSLNLGVYRLFGPANSRSFEWDDPLKVEFDAIDYRLGIRYSFQFRKSKRTNT